MDLEIKWTKRAASSFHDTIEYIEKEWSIKSAQKFIKKVSKLLDILLKQPKIGKSEVKENGIRGYVFSRHITVFYRIKNNKIILLHFFDNRQNPTKKPCI